MTVFKAVAVPLKTR